MSLKRKNAGSSKCGPNAKQRCEIKAALNDAITECVDDMKTCWNSRESFDKGNIHFSATPFRYCLIENFLSDGNFLKDLKAEVGDANLKKKRNDLYQFHQSSDLSAMNKPVSNSFRKFLKEKCKPWLEKITGMKLNNKISSTFSAYNFTDHLLCHDDKCDDRRIAFILYLSENWLPECGGSLQLFDAEADSEPITVVKDIQPVFNSFVFFEVSRKSHHQVCEVTSMDRTRLSVNGWFHGSLPDGEVEEDYYSSPFKLERFPPSIVESRLSKYVNKMYLQPAAQKQILEVFSRESEILLPDFIETSFYNELCECLASESLSWKMDGPPNRRRYESVQAEVLPEPLNKLIKSFRSKGFFRLLAMLTGLALAPDEDEDEKGEKGICCSFEIQRWKKGFYSLLRDDQYTGEYALDVILYFNTEGIEQLQGGNLSFVGLGREDEYLTVVPKKNALALAYRDTQTIYFVKYIEHTFTGTFHSLHFTYYEEQDTARRRSFDGYDTSVEGESSEEDKLSYEGESYGEDDEDSSEEDEELSSDEESSDEDDEESSEGDEKLSSDEDEKLSFEEDEKISSEEDEKQSSKRRGKPSTGADKK